MSKVLFFIHIPYERNSPVNEEIIRKKRDWDIDENVPGENENQQSDTEQGNQGMKIQSNCP